MPGPDERLSLGVMRQMAIDAATAEMVAALGAEGIKTILLKGAAIANRLYDNPSARFYSDFDLLVAPSRFGDAASIARRLGYENELEGNPRTNGQFTQTLGGAGLVSLDLHQFIYWFRGDPKELWNVFSAGATQEIMLFGVPVPVLSDAALALVITAHRVQHGGLVKTGNDLDQALARFDGGVWRETRELAKRLAMLQVLGFGLRTTEAGRARAAELDLPTEADFEMRIRLTGQVTLTSGIVRLAQERSLIGAAKLLARELVPTPAFMRHNGPFARHGLGGLMLAYLCRPFYLAYHLPAALSQVRTANRMRRSVAASDFDHQS